MNTSSLQALLTRCFGVVVAGLALAAGPSSAEALALCAAPPVPEARSVAFDARVFERGGTSLSLAGRSELSGFARRLDPHALEVVIVSVPVGTVADDTNAVELARQRGEVVRDQLAREGVLRERIYLEQRRMAVPARVAAQSPMVIETVGAAPRHAALARGWRCLA